MGENAKNFQKWTFRQFEQNIKCFPKTFYMFHQKLTQFSGLESCLPNPSRSRVQKVRVRVQVKSEFRGPRVRLSTAGSESERGPSRVWAKSEPNCIIESLLWWGVGGGGLGPSPCRPLNLRTECLKLIHAKAQSIVNSTVSYQWWCQYLLKGTASSLTGRRQQFEAPNSDALSKVLQTQI